jgi:hypothetical protein
MLDRITCFIVIFINFSFCTAYCSEENRLISVQLHPSSALKGEFEGCDINFQEEDVAEDNDCGFHAIGISRDEAIRQLTDAVTIESIRALVGQEIKAEFINDNLPTIIKSHSGYLTLRERYFATNDILTPLEERYKKELGAVF